MRYIYLLLSIAIVSAQVPPVNSGTATYPTSGTIMVGVNNLSEITSAATARTNLGINGTLICGLLTLTSDVTTSASCVTTIANGAVTAVKMINAGVHTGDSTSTFPAITISNGAITAVKMVNAGVFTGDATSTFPAITIGAGAITLAKQANLAANSFQGNNTASPATPLALTVAQSKTLLAIACADLTNSSALCSAATPLTGANGGTGVVNTGFTITLAGNLATSGAFNTTFAQGATTTQTLPTTSQTIPGMNQVNTAGSSFTLDMSSAGATAGHKVPVAAGAVPTANGALSYDSTANGYVGGVNGVTNYFPLATKLLTFTGATAARSIALPADAAFTIARQDAAQTFTGLQTFSGISSAGTKFTASGCSNSATTGGATAGTYTSGTTGTCTVVITMNGATGLTAPTGWDCAASDRTTAADTQRTSTSNTTTATISGTTVSGDVISFHCMAY